ncbi:hypothetical protein NLI96_g2903 [Meripilus lineatus]|uniref:Exonuclease domain-containing protein n=1 Tax=Meripilus lineatus TaxID=2056292 RepID=A0AAD5V9X7_9APHY|nr:hypothetical protein NLI96_g2903 [Physisporinus lineatus]
MFPAKGLFQSLPCPERSTCKRICCPFSHDPNVKLPPIAHIVAEAPKSILKPSSSSLGPVASSSRTPATDGSIPAKRSVSSPLRTHSRNGTSSSDEPPRKLQKVGTLQKPSAIPSAQPAKISSGAPTIRVNPAQSLVAISVRQAVITSIAALKRRASPDSISHPSVGTEAEVQLREEARKKLESLRLKTADLEPYVLSVDEMKKWNYIVEIPDSVGGERPSEEGSIQKCERCNEQFKVKRKEEADPCRYHWGRPYTRTANGEKRRLYNCCYRTMEDEGCERGPHVFYESDPEQLHRRHAFSPTRKPRSAGDSALEAVALDCEMIYSTGGMRVARVSVVDSAGKEIFDEIIRMDEGVEVIDFNTRFSGITPESYASAVSPLASIRESLDVFINSNTIIIGHALENDLKTLRMIHHRCVDTAVMFPHKLGAPYRRALRDLAKEHLGKTIQRGGGTVGHSSVEDSIATLDLVRWRVLNGPKPQPKKSPAYPQIS